MAEVTFNEVDKVYAAGVYAVKDLTLDIHDGEFLVLVGPSGCGKTTALRMVAGLEEISDGTISIGDRIVNALERGRRRVIYPGRMRVGFTLPGVARWYSRTLAARTWSTVDSARREELMGMAVRTGSMGDAVAREAREAC